MFTETKATSFNQFLTKTYSIMFLNIVVSAIASFITINFMPQLITSTAFAWGSLITIILFSLIFTHVTIKNPANGFILMLIFSYLIGVSSSSIFLVYTQASITGAFISASSLFAGLSLYGVTTKRNVNSIGGYVTALILGAFIIEVVNIFLHSSMLATILDWIFLIGFMIYTIIDTNNLKRLYAAQSSQHAINALAILGAFNLYLDFVNIFLSLVELFDKEN